MQDLYNYHTVQIKLSIFFCNFSSRFTEFSTQNNLLSNIFHSAIFLSLFFFSSYFLSLLFCSPSINSYAPFRFLACFFFLTLSSFVSFILFPSSIFAQFFSITFLLSLFVGSRVLFTMWQEDYSLDNILKRN